MYFMESFMHFPVALLTMLCLYTRGHCSITLGDISLAAVLSFKDPPAFLVIQQTSYKNRRGCINTNSY